MMINALTVLYIALAAVLIFFLVLPFFTVLISLMGKEKIKRSGPNTKDYRRYDFGCIITAYKDAQIAIPLIDSLLEQPYPDFHIYLVADECDLSGFDFRHDQLSVLHPDPALRLKAKSIIYAMDRFVRPHDFSVVFDADNLAHPQFLTEINTYANNGFRTIQGRRIAKNLDTVYACADATGEYYKNYVERYASYGVGSSAVISGSGMAVDTVLYRDYLNSPEIEQGKHQWKKMLQEDKILQNYLVGNNKRIAYAWNAVVYDEKVVNARQVETQRSRWLYSYFQNLPNAANHIARGIAAGNASRFLFGLNTISPPLFILVFMAAVFALAGWWLSPAMTTSLCVALLIFGLNVLWTLYLSKVPAAVWTTLWGLPLFVVRQVTALFKMGNPNKNFKHSQHSRHYSIDEVMGSREEKEA